MVILYHASLKGDFMTTQDLFKIIKTKGVMRAAELSSYVSTRAQLGRYAESGKLTALGAGYYAHPSLDPFTASIMVVAKYYPETVISNLTALVIHGLSDERIDRIDVDIPKTSSLRNKLICAHRIPPIHIIGVVHQNFHGSEIRIYNLERTLCDAYHIDPDGPIFLKALKRYMKSSSINPDQIAKFDRILGTKVLRSLTQELANE